MTQANHPSLAKPILIMLICMGMACFTGFKLYGILVARGTLPGATYAALPIVDYQIATYNRKTGPQHYLVVEQTDGTLANVHVPAYVFDQYDTGGVLEVVYVPFEDHPHAVEGNHSSDETYAFDIFLFAIEVFGIAFCLIWILISRARRKSQTRYEATAPYGQY